MHTASCHSTVSGPNRTLVVLLHYKLTSCGSVFALTYSRSHPPAARLYTGDPRHLLDHCIKHLSFCCLAYFLLRCSRPRSRRSSSSRALENTGELEGGGVILWLSHFSIITEFLKTLSHRSLTFMIQIYSLSVSSVILTTARYACLTLSLWHPCDGPAHLSG